MRNKILIIGGVAFLAYILGSRAARGRTVASESVGHQIVRLWNEPKAKRARRKNAKHLAGTVQQGARRAKKAARKKVRRLAKQ